MADRKDLYITLDRQLKEADHGISGVLDTLGLLEQLKMLDDNSKKITLRRLKEIKLFLERSEQYCGEVKIIEMSPCPDCRNKNYVSECKKCNGKGWI